jgi:hypothetical protein
MLTETKGDKWVELVTKEEVSGDKYWGDGGYIVNLK